MYQHGCLAPAASSQVQFNPLFPVIKIVVLMLCRIKVALAISGPRRAQAPAFWTHNRGPLPQRARRLRHGWAGRNQKYIPHFHDFTS